MADGIRELKGRVIVNDEFSFERDKDCWVLYRFHKATRADPRTGVINPDGGTTRRSYFSRLRHVLAHILDQASLLPEETASISDLQKALEEMTEKIISAVETHSTRKPSVVKKISKTSKISGTKKKKNFPSFRQSTGCEIE